MSTDSQNTPPKGDMDQAEKYINQLVALINQNKIEVYHTDLSKFDPTALRDHYTIGLRDYQIEISHSKHAETDKNSYVMIFNNLKNLAKGSGEKVILAYIYLADSQYSKFKIVVDSQIETRRRIEEERKFKDAVEPIDELLTSVSSEKSYENPDNYSTKEFNRPEENFSETPQIHQT